MNEVSYKKEVDATCAMVKQQLDGVFLTLQQLDIKSTTNNVRYLFGVYSAIEKIAQHVEVMQQIGGEDNVEQQGE